MSAQKPYLPYLMRIETVTDEAPLVKTFRLKFADEAQGAAFTFRTGQFGEYSVFGEGESTFCIASPSTRQGYIECTFREAGRVTRALAMRGPGDTLGFRGPYGNTFPMDQWKGKNLVFVAGGIGLPPLRSLIWTCLDKRGDFGDITIVYGAKTVADLVYKNELAAWAQRSDIRLVQTVDPGGATPDWQGKVGLIPAVLKEAAPGSKGGVAVVCGPPIMIKFALMALADLGFPDDAITTTMENRMKCGVGKCGRCNIGSTYVCKDGPVFTVTQLKAMPHDY